MEIAATGLALPLMGPGRDRPQSPPNESARARDRQANPENPSSRQATGQAGNERVIRGEVISSQTESARPVGGMQSSNESSSSSFTPSDTRRFSMQAAIQTFRENEAMVTDPATPRQVSGIIDVFV